MAFNTTPNLFFNSNLCFDMHKRFVMTVLTVKISDDDSTLIQKHLMYEQTVCLNHEDPTLIRLVNEAIGKIEQTRYTHRLGTRPDWVVSNVAQNSGLYAKFAIARCIQNQNWVTGLNVTAEV